MFVKIPVSALVLVAVFMTICLLQYAVIIRLHKENKSLRRRLDYAEGGLEPVNPERRWDNDNSGPYIPLNPWYWDSIIQERPE